MIVFHEGLSGAGKSYEACVMHILPALKNGRRVVTNIEGINHAKFSEISGIPEVMLVDYLICIFCDGDIDRQKEAILEHSRKDSLIVIDEIQNLFPSERQKLSDSWNKYISEHRHDGLDIVLMGQDRRDCHAMWRRRVQRCIVFTKLTALGRDNSYRWEALEATSPEKFKKMNAGTCKYEKRYFGLYSSHTDGTKHKIVYTDKRATIWSSGTFKWVIPGAVVAAYFAITHLFAFFTPPDTKAVATPAQQVAVPPKVANEPKETVTVKQAQAPNPQRKKNDDKESEYQPIDVFDDFANKYRPRLAGLMTRHKDGKVLARIELLDGNYHVQDVYDLDAVRDLGWSINVRASGLHLTKKGRSYVVRAWPVDEWGKVNRGRQEALGSPSFGSPQVAAIQRPSNNAVLINHQPRARSDFN